MSSQTPAPKLQVARQQVTHPHAFASSSFPTRPGSPISISSLSEGSPVAEDHTLLSTGEELTKRRQVVSIDAIPDDALLVIFDHHMYGARQGLQTVEHVKNVEKAWRLLVQVCHRWRSIVFESPRRLDLRLFCTGLTPARDRLDVWPTLPLIIMVEFNYYIRRVDDIIASLERTDRVCQINLVNIKRSDMEMFLAAMQQPFPELTYLKLWSKDETVLVPDSFLDGSTPRLEYFLLNYIPFPGLPKLLLSATQLVDLVLSHIPHPGYFPPDAIATVLPTLNNLNSFELDFISPRSCPDRESRRPPLSTRSVLPVLTKFQFKGVSEYLEDLVARIEAPQLEYLLITFFYDIVFDTPRLIQFLSQMPKLKALEKASIVCWDHSAQVEFSSLRRSGGLTVKISCKGLNWQLSSLEQVCTFCLPPLSMLENLYFYDGGQTYWKDDMDDEPWVELLRPFSAVKNLYLTHSVARRVALTLQEHIEGRTTEVLPTILPTLQEIFMQGLKSSGHVQEGIQQFVAARQVAGDPIVISRW